MKSLFFIVLFALLVVIGLYFNSNSSPLTQVPLQNTSNYSIPSSTTYNLKLPAVGANRQGVLADLELLISPGEGRVYTRIDGDNPLVNTDTQNSMKRAVNKARTFTHVQDNDLYFSMNSGSDLVGGVSAGAAFTVMTIAALKGEKLRNDTLLTGSIELDGTIGPVGKVLEKATAVKKAGYTRFLVPKGEGITIQDKTDCLKKDFENGFYESCTSVPIQVNIQNKTGLEVIEVSNFTQAYDLMVVK